LFVDLSLGTYNVNDEVAAKQMAVNSNGRSGRYKHLQPFR